MISLGEHREICRWENPNTLKKGTTKIVQTKTGHNQKNGSREGLQ
jgi:hypothetical protein